MPMTAAEFEALYAQHSRAVWAVAYARQLRAEAAQDIMQEAFLKLWQAAERGEEIQYPRAWLLRVARNAAEDQAKSRFHRNGTCDPGLLTGFALAESSPVDQLLQAETRAQVRDALRELPVADRELLTMRYAFDYDVATIAAALDIRPSAVHMRLSRARQRLAEHLAVPGGSR